MGRPGMARFRKRERRGSFHSRFSSFLSPSSTLGSMHDQSAASRWSAEVLGAIAVHLSLLQKDYCQEHESNSDDCTSAVLDGHCDIDDDKIIVNNDSKDEHDTSAMELADLINCKGPALPEGWEQHLDVRTGQVFYIHWKSCKKSYADPRKAAHVANEKVSELLHHARTTFCSGPHSGMIEEKSDPSDCITCHCAIMSAHTDEEVQSMPTPICSSTSNIEQLHEDLQSRIVCSPTPISLATPDYIK